MTFIIRFRYPGDHEATVASFGTIADLQRMWSAARKDWADAEAYVAEEDGTVYKISPFARWDISYGSRWYWTGATMVSQFFNGTEWRNTDD